MRKLLLFAMLAVVLNIAVAQSSSFRYVPFAASIPDLLTVPATSNEGCPNDTVRLNASGTALTTHLGQAVGTESICMNPNNLTFTTHFKFVAANGDEILGQASGYGVATSPTSFKVYGSWTFDGGTGRFEGVKGSGTATGDVDLVTGASPHQMVGIISSVGSSK